MSSKSTVAMSLAGMLVLGTVAFADTKVATTRVETKTVTKHTRHAEPTQAELQKQAKITMVEARAIALKSAAGTIKSEELENEHGKLIYSFDISTGEPGITEVNIEVNIDAMNGKVIAVQKENAAKEASEKKQEPKEAKAKADKH